MNKATKHALQEVMQELSQLPPEEFQALLEAHRNDDLARALNGLKEQQQMRNVDIQLFLLQPEEREYEYGNYATAVTALRKGDRYVSDDVNELVADFYDAKTAELVCKLLNKHVLSKRKS